MQPLFTYPLAVPVAVLATTCRRPDGFRHHLQCAAALDSRHRRHRADHRRRRRDQHQSPGRGGLPHHVRPCRRTIPQHHPERPRPRDVNRRTRGEADLDVEWAGAVAKGATIDLVVSESTEATAGIDLSALYIIDNNLAPVMSESYGACEADLGAGGNAFYNTLWEQAAAQGITVLIAAGDTGSAGCDSAELRRDCGAIRLGVSGIASTPFNVAVGGTDFNDVEQLHSRTGIPDEHFPVAVLRQVVHSRDAPGTTPARPPGRYWLHSAALRTYLSDGY